ncbi:MAG: R3H domain-containing nucleic acid-binding protein [bacterium]|nr:R3H domain-containing nucleic acid-binding protein [bacterium]
MEEKNLKIIQETVKELMEKAGFSCEVEAREFDLDDQEGVLCNIKNEGDSNLLIGQFGINLQSFQHIARLIVRKKISDKANFILDVNSYREQKNQSVIRQANEVAEQVINEGRVIIMKPMSAYERRLVHLELSKNEKVKTESVGEGENRKIMVKPANDI